MPADPARTPERLTQPALLLYAHVGTVMSDGSTAAPKVMSSTTLPVSEVRVLPDGWLELVREVGLKQAALLLTIAQLSVVIRGELVCTATNAELGQAIGRNRDAVGRVLGKVDGSNTDSLVGRGLVTVKVNKTETGMRGRGRRVWLHPTVYRWGSGAHESSRVQHSRADVSAELVHTSAAVADVRAPQDRAHGEPTHGPVPPREHVAGSAPLPRAPQARAAEPRTFDGVDGDDLHHPREPDTRTDDARRSRALTQLLRWGYRGADDALEQFGLELVEATIAFVAARTDVDSPAGYVSTLLRQGGPPEQAARPSPPRPRPISDPTPLHAPGRPVGPVVAHPDQAEHGVAAQQPPRAEAPSPAVADGPASGHDTPPSADAGRPEEDESPPPWPLPGLDAEVVTAVEDEVAAKLPPGRPRSGPMFTALCRATARDWGLID